MKNIFEVIDENIKSLRNNKMFNLKKELETYFYNKGYGRESLKEAADMVAFLKTVLNERLNDLEDIAFNLRNEIFALKDSFFK